MPVIQPIADTLFPSQARAKKWQTKKLLQEILLVVIPSLIWIAGIHSRPLLIQPACGKNPEICSSDHVPAIDRIALGQESDKADHYSYLGQNISAGFAIALPSALTGLRLLSGTLNPVVSLSIWGTDLLIFFQATAWNGMLTEISHLLTGRARPFVYSNPPERGLDPSHYTSFYSGHTSFTAAAGLTTFLLLFLRNAPFYLLVFSAASAQTLLLGTAFFRMLAGRHFFTDVACGALAGMAVAFFIVARHRLEKSPTQKQARRGKAQK